MKHQKILISYYQSTQKYEKLALEIHRLFETDPDFPKESIYTVKHRLKATGRLIEKIDDLNENGKAPRITNNNYQNHVGDLLGMRIVCLRRSDVEKVGRYLESLAKERKLRFVRKPVRKQPPFLWINNPKEKLPKGKDLQYTGYSSIHYIVALGRNLNPQRDLASLRAEIQVRTILEEAWGEIDHKYRYELKRSGTEIPDSMDRGFRAFSAYLQAAAVQAEYLCKDAESLLNSKVDRKRTKAKGSLPTPPTPVFETPQPAKAAPPVTPLSTVEAVLKNKFDFVPTERTLAYVRRRMADVFIPEYQRVNELDQRILTDEAIEIFTNTYIEIFGHKPFSDFVERDIDLLNAFNYSLFRVYSNKDLALENLKSILRARLRPPRW
jgi:putative GTP pyrophosphokinase